MGSDGTDTAAGPGSDSSRYFTVVHRATSAAILLPEQGFEIPLINPGPLQGGFRIRMSTRWEHAGFGSPIPRELTVEVRGPASSLDEATLVFSQLARLAGLIFAFTANATVGRLEPHIAFESTEGLDSREFREVFLPDERGLPRRGRLVRTDHLVAVADGFLQAGERRVHTALNQYELALRSWTIGTESLCLSHLWMAVEAMTPLFLLQELSRQGLTKDRAGREELAARLGLQVATPRDLSKVDAWVRQTLILGGEVDLYGAARRASDGFEHGFMDITEVHLVAIERAEALFGHVRRALLDLLGVTGPSYDSVLELRPLDSASFRKIIRGRFTGSTGEMAASDQRYPILHWSSSVRSAEREGDQIAISFNETFKVVAADGVAFTGEAIEWRGRGPVDPDLKVQSVNVVSTEPIAEPARDALARALEIADSCELLCNLGDGLELPKADVARFVAYTWFAHSFAAFQATVRLSRDHRSVEAVQCWRRCWRHRVVSFTSLAMMISEVPLSSASWSAGATRSGVWRQPNAPLSGRRPLAKSSSGRHYLIELEISSARSARCRGHRPRT